MFGTRLFLTDEFDSVDGILDRGVGFVFEEVDRSSDGGGVRVSSNDSMAVMVGM